MKFKKKPVVVDAFQWTGDTKELDRELGRNWGRADAHDVPWNHDDTEQVVIWNSAENIWIPCPLYHWIIRGVHGEYYPCDNEIFKKTYEQVPL